MDYAIPDGGGKPAGAKHEGHVHGGTSVVDLRGPHGTPQRRFTLTARQATVRLASGRSVEVLSFNGTVPGPELRVREGELVEVTLRNRDVADGVTVHWHGVDVPNGEDGVAGVTQDAVPPGGATSTASAPSRSGRSGTTPTRRRRRRCGAGSTGRS